MTNRRAALKALDRLVASHQAYTVGYSDFVDWPVTRALQVTDLLAVRDLVSFGIGSAATSVSIVKTVVDNFISLVNALRSDQRMFEQIGAIRGGVAWTFGDTAKPRFDEPRARSHLSRGTPSYSGQRLERELREIRTAHDGAVDKMWRQLDTLSVRWVERQWRARTGGGAPGAHVRAGRRPVQAAPLPPTAQPRTAPEDPRNMFRFLILLATNDDRSSLEVRLFDEAAWRMSSMDRKIFERTAPHFL